MKIGKVPENVLKRSILKQLGTKRPEVVVRPGVGEDCAVLQLEADEMLVLSTDPITGAVKEIGTLAIHITANDIASSGAELIGVMLTIILPDQTTEEELKEMMKSMSTICAELNVEIVGGHTEVSAAVNQPIVSVTGVGKVKKDRLITTKGAKPNQDIVMTKWAALEGSSIIAHEKEETLRKTLSEAFIQRVKDFNKYLSVIPEAKVASTHGVAAMHDITEGGIFGALWEMAAASKVGVEVDLRKIPIKQETIEVCEVFDLNPYMLISSGSMLIITDRGSQLVDKLQKEGIHAAVIGKTTEGNDKVILNEDETRYLEPPKEDELYKIYQ